MKRYPLPDQLSGHALLLIARTEERAFAGYLIASRAWNGCARIDDLAVDRAHRGVGTGRALVQVAIAWAREAGLAAIRIETQSNNVPALRFYRRLGFELAGSDRLLYSQLGPAVRGETALYCYLLL